MRDFFFCPGVAKAPRGGRYPAIQPLPLATLRIQTKSIKQRRFWTVGTQRWTSIARLWKNPAVATEQSPTRAERRGINPKMGYSILGFRLLWCLDCLAPNTNTCAGFS